MSTNAHKERDLKEENVPAWKNIADDDTYVFSPLYRLRNSGQSVFLGGSTGVPFQYVHRAVGVTLALCDGKRTVADIVKITRPLVKVADDAEAIRIAARHVKQIIYSMCEKIEESRGENGIKNDTYPRTVLLKKQTLENRFRHSKFKCVAYDPLAFVSNNGNGSHTEPAPQSRETAPVVLNWHFTSMCSTDCKYCYADPRKVSVMPKERVLSLLKEAAQIGVLAIDPNVTDFLLYPYLREVLEAFVEHRFLPTMISTKSFLSKEKAKLLAEAGSVVMRLQFSIDSSVGDVADYLVRSKNYCERIYTSIENALEAGLIVDAKAVITPYNILTIPKLYRDLKARGVTEIHLASYMRSGYRHTDEFFNYPETYQWLEKQLEILQEEFPNDRLRIQNGAPAPTQPTISERKYSWGNRSACTAGRFHIVICSDGKVVPCTQMPETEEYFCGDVNHQSILEVWNGHRLREMTWDIPQEKFRGQPCHDCEDRVVCTSKVGCCIRDLAVHQGSIYLPPCECPKYERPYIRMV